MSSSKRSYAIASALALLAVFIVAIFVASSNNDTPTGSNLHRHLTESSSSSSSLLDENRVLPSLFPLTWPSDYLGFTCATLGLLLAAGGGIGK